MPHRLLRFGARERKRVLVAAGKRHDAPCSRGQALQWHWRLRARVRAPDENASAAERRRAVVLALCGQDVRVRTTTGVY